jgi:hypothetical protein
MKRRVFLTVLVILILAVFLNTVSAEEDPTTVARSITEDRLALQRSQESARTASYDLSWWTVDGGGATPSESSVYALGGTSGQPDAAAWSGGDYTLAGGFWGGVSVEYRICLPLVLRN